VLAYHGGDFAPTVDPPQLEDASFDRCHPADYSLTWPSSVPEIRLRQRDHARGDRHMPQKKPTVYEFIPKLGQLRDDVLFGDVWEHPDLSKRDRSLITVAMLAALYRTDEMRGHMQRALDNGVTETELKGLITHVAFYAGWPCAVNAGRIAIDVFGPK
jgi:4-carboxymuconolactone decarboxylase